MKNSAVELMIRNQFNVDDNITINVECMFSDLSGYHFEVWWVDSEDNHYQCNMLLPQLNINCRNLGE